MGSERLTLVGNRLERYNAREVKKMNREEIIDHIGKLYERALGVIRVKNADYTTAEDGYANFRAAEMVGVEVERAIMVRLMDKVVRVNNLLGRPGEVMDEKVEDTILDAINYLALLHGYLSDGED